ncbi:hypothetical protein Zmor_001488 [Zophobas morio]|uniref:Uncharacterized protein n=1 Tax=Zophobas morio TaxID=2755281 RepID=A0AA38J2R5_9CUCU|nr:hypothetical protein Zmor_001488 [Zophobas morio]
MHLGTNNPLLTLNIANQQLKVVEYHSDLGITITPSLSWSQHVGEIVKRTNRSIFLFSKAFRNLDFQSFCYLFKSDLGQFGAADLTGDILSQSQLGAGTLWRKPTWRGPSWRE